MAQSLLKFQGTAARGILVYSKDKRTCITLIYLFIYWWKSDHVYIDIIFDHERRHARKISSYSNKRGKKAINNLIQAVKRSTIPKRTTTKYYKTVNPRIETGRAHRGSCTKMKLVVFDRKRRTETIRKTTAGTGPDIQYIPL